MNVIHSSILTNPWFLVINIPVYCWPGPIVSLKSDTPETIQNHCFAQRPPSSHPPTHPVQTLQQRREQWQPAKASSPSMNPKETHNVSVLHTMQITCSFYLQTIMRKYMHNVHSAGTLHVFVHFLLLMLYWVTRALGSEVWWAVVRLPVPFYNHQCQRAQQYVILANKILVVSPVLWCPSSIVVSEQYCTVSR